VLLDQRTESIFHQLLKLAFGEIKAGLAAPIIDVPDNPITLDLAERGQSCFLIGKLYNRAVGLGRSHEIYTPILLKSWRDIHLNLGKLESDISGYSG